MCGLFAGLLGSIVGLGGGIVIVPLLTLVFGVPIKNAIATSLISVCATSIGGATRYLRAGTADLRLGLFLETATVVGALGGGTLALAVKPQIIGITFALMLFYTGFAMLFKSERQSTRQGIAHAGQGKSSTNIIVLALSFVGGLISSFLGVGGGVVKVPIMNLVLNLPLKVATATSTYMIGITTAAGSLIYLVNGMIDYHIAAPLILGTYAGASLGAHIAAKADSRIIRYILVAIMIYVAINIGLKQIGIRLL